jgi:hypothetical protein
VRYWHFAALQFLFTGSTNEDSRYVRVSFTGLCIEFCVVSFTSSSYRDTVNSAKPSLDELVKDGQNGVIFEDADGLADHLEVLHLSSRSKYVANRFSLDSSSRVPRLQCPLSPSSRIYTSPSLTFSAWPWRMEHLGSELGRYGQAVGDVRVLPEDRRLASRVCRAEENGQSW